MGSKVKVIYALLLIVFFNISCIYERKRSNEIILDKQNINKFHSQIIEAGQPDSFVRIWLSVFDTIKNPSIRMEYIYKKYVSSFHYLRDIGDDKVLPAEQLFSYQNFSGDCDDFAIGLYAISKALDYNGRLCFVQYENKKGHVFFQLRLCHKDQIDDFRLLPSIVGNPFFSYYECDDTYCWLTLENGYPPKKGTSMPIIHEIQITTSGEIKQIGEIIN